MITLIIAFLFTTLAFGIFLYYYAWHNRFTTQMRLAINETGGRVISIKRILRTKKNLQEKNHLEVMVNQVEWQIVYKDKFESVYETRCHIKNDQLHWHPPLL